MHEYRIQLRPRAMAAQTYIDSLIFLCQLPFWQRHIIFLVSSKTWNALKYVFHAFLYLKYFIELKFINLKNSVCFSLYISVIGPRSCCLVRVFGPSFWKIHISFVFWRRKNLKTVLESIFWKLFSVHDFNGANRRFRRWHR